MAEDLPQARIITYGYYADVVHLTPEAGLNTVRDHAANLILSLSKMRDGHHQASERPIMFPFKAWGEPEGKTVPSDRVARWFISMGTGRAGKLPLLCVHWSSVFFFNHDCTPSWGTAVVVVVGCCSRS